MRTYEVRVRNQLVREVVCDELTETEDALTFSAGDVTVFKVPKRDIVWWQLKNLKGKQVGVKKKMGLSFMNGLRVGTSIKRGN